ncbi:MAG TPA: hypothetical protein VK599_12485 [Streptosporangiaceae bacterium]|nr:hypothetical protein [Streptosporangiaceae bacterium]
MIAGLRLRWARRRLRNEPVPRDGRPLTDRETRALGTAWNALLDKKATRSVAVAEWAAEWSAQVLAAEKERGPE